MLQFLLMGLEDEGFEVDMFTDSPLALSMVQAGKKYDLLILDIQMPDMMDFISPEIIIEAHGGRIWAENN